MPKQGDTSKCFLIRCDGTATWHEKLNIDIKAGRVSPSNSVGGRPDHNYSGWLCAKCGEAFWDKP